MAPDPASGVPATKVRRQARPVCQPLVALLGNKSKGALASCQRLFCCSPLAVGALDARPVLGVHSNLLNTEASEPLRVSQGLSQISRLGCYFLDVQTQSKDPSGKLPPIGALEPVPTLFLSVLLVNPSSVCTTVAAPACRMV